MFGNIPILHTTSYRSESAIVQTGIPKELMSAVLKIQGTLKATLHKLYKIGIRK
jgi:hypothetical protein